MAATKKQVNDIENAVVVLEERIEKMEEEHHLLKQMISMQSTLIDNLQMMVKMMSVQPSYKVMHVGGETNSDIKADDVNTKNDIVDEQQGVQSQSHSQSHSIKTLKTRMSRVM